MHDSSASKAEVEVLTGVTRDLVGVALRSITPEGVNLAQFRLLLVLYENGTAASAQVARSLDLAPSSVTRMADRLVAAGLVERGGTPEHRGVVALSLTSAGASMVKRVSRRRHDELAGVLDCLPPEVRSTAIEAFKAIHDLLGQDRSIGAAIL